MQKVPVLETVSAVYQFTIQNYVKMLGIMWAPMALMFAVMVWQFVPMMASMQAGSKDPAVLLAMMGHALMFEGAAFLLLIIIAVGFTKLSLGREVRWPYFYLSIGGDFWRLLLAYFLAFLIMLAALFAVSLLSGVVMVVLSSLIVPRGADQAQRIAALSTLTPIIAIAVYGAMLFVAIRFAFLLAPIVILEKRIGLGRNWTLTHGNSWRIFLLVILLLLPLIALVCLQYFLMAVFGGPGMNIVSSWGNPQAQMAWSRAVMDMYMRYWFVYIPIGFLLGPIFYGPLMTAGAFVYRALHPDEPANVF